MAQSFLLLLICILGVLIDEIWRPSSAPPTNVRVILNRVKPLIKRPHQYGLCIPAVRMFFLVSDPLCLSSSSALHFSDYSFRVHHLVNQDDLQLLAHAMTSDFSVAWQCLSKRTIGFFVMDQTPPPYPTRSLPTQLDTGAQNVVLCGSRQSH
jgi:hypothetical protein